MEYKHRIADQMLSKKLASKGAILIEGPKWCGKTTTAEQQANSILYMDNPASLDTNLQMAEIDASVLLDGETPRLIDERQYWDWVLKTSLTTSIQWDSFLKPFVFVICESLQMCWTEKCTIIATKTGWNVMQ